MSMWVIFITSMAVIALVASVVISLAYKIVTAIIKINEDSAAEIAQRRKEFDEQHQKVKDNIK